MTDFHVPSEPQLRALAILGLLWCTFTFINRTHIAWHMDRKSIVGYNRYNMDNRALQNRGAASIAPTCSHTAVVVCAASGEGRITCDNSWVSRLSKCWVCFMPE